MLFRSKDAFRQAAREVLQEMQTRKIDNPEMLEKLEMVTNAFSSEKFTEVLDEKAILILKDIIVKLALEGRYIILGRGATTILADLPNKLSIRLEAPLEWRINRVAQMKNMSHDTAEEYIMKADEKRRQFTEAVIGRTYNNYDFDVIFNYASLSDDQIVDAIVNILKSKKIITPFED